MIEVRNFSKTLKGRKVLENINLSLKPGMIYGFKGVNGSGKTMLMRAICGLIYSRNGEVLIDGKVLGKDIDFPPSIGLLLENPSFLGGYTGFDNLKMLASLKKGITDEMISGIISEVGLDPKDTRKYSKYSLGMKQRLGIAQAFLGAPRIVVLDEPFNALDEDGIAMIIPLIRRAKDNGSVVIMACHDNSQLSGIADEVIVINEGRIKEIIQSTAL